MAFSLKTLQQNYNQYVYSDLGPTHEYFNMGLFNEYTPNNTLPRTLKFNQIKQAPIIDKCDDYFLSIIRWNLQSNLPVLIPDIQIKPNGEAFTGLTDYELAFFYNVETSVKLQNTFGLLGADGTNYLGIYKTGDFGDLKKVVLNFPPDDGKSVDYDNVPNGLLPNGNGSLYIISGGVLKIFDKISKIILQTFTPASGVSYKYITTNKSTGDFYVGVVSNSNDFINYYEGSKVNPTTWQLGVTAYVSPTNKYNVNDITFVDGRLNELASTQFTPDTLFGVYSGSAFEIDIQDTQLTNVPTLISPLAKVSNNFYFAVGNDNETYATPFPIASPPVNMFVANSATPLKYIYSSHAEARLYGVGTTNLYYQFNAADSPAGPATNTWAEFGEFSLNGTATGILTIDNDDFNNNIFAVGADNNMYISQHPIAPYEFCQFGGDPNNPTKIGSNLVGFDLAGTSAKSYILNSNLPFNGKNLDNARGCFKHLLKYFYVEDIGANNYTLIEYDGINGNIITTYPNLDTRVFQLTYLPISSNFAYWNSLADTIVIRSCANPNTIIQTFTVPLGANIWSICEIDATHIAISDLTNIYIFVYGTSTTINTITSIDGVSDITFNPNDIVNSAGKLFYTNNANILNLGIAGNAFYEVTFTSNAYTTANPRTLIYTSPPNRYQQYIQCKPENGTICLLETDFPTGFIWNNRTMSFFFQQGGYNPSSIFTVSYPFTNTSLAGTGIPRKPNIWMNDSTMSTNQFTQINSNVPVVSACVSRVNSSLIYAIGTDSRVYQGTLVTNNVNLSLVNITASPYSYISCQSAPSAPLVNTIQQWATTGNPSTIAQVSNTTTPSTNPSPAYLYNDGTNLYAILDNVNNLTTMFKFNPAGLSEIASLNYANLQILNGLVGFDSNNNILLSNVIDGANSLTSISPTTLELINNYLDPNTDYGTTTMLTFPFDFFENETTYAQLGDTTTLVFIPETVNVNLDNILDYPRNKEELFSNPYFYIKYVDTFCRMFNNAIKTAWATTAGTWTKLPYIQWDSALNKIVYNQPTSTPTGTPAPTGSNFYVSVNQPLYNLLNTFRFKYFPTQSGNGSLYPESAECRYLLDTNILFDGAVQAGGEYVTYLQQISSVQTWTPIQSWVFSSTIIPIESQLTGQPQNLNDVDPTTQGNIYKQQSITKVLTDFIVPLNSGVEATNQNVFYTPAGEYRLVDLLGGASLNQLSLEIKWRDKYGVDHDMYLDAGASANLLVLLRKKSYNSRM